MNNGAGNKMLVLTLDVSICMFNRTVGNALSKGVTGKNITFQRFIELITLKLSMIISSFGYDCFSGCIVCQGKVTSSLCYYYLADIPFYI